MIRTRQRPNSIKPIDLQALGAELRIYGEIDDPNMRYFNPCLEFDSKGNLKIAIRSCNFKVERGGHWSLRDGRAYSVTNVIYGDVDPETMQVSNLKKLELSDNTPTRTKVVGLEDVRLFNRPDGMHAIGYESDRLTHSLHNASASMAEYLIKDGTLHYIRTLQKPIKEAVEKNWSPTNVPVKEFDFTYSPWQTWKDGKVIGEKYQGQVHGGSQLIQQKDGTFLSIVHEKYADRLYGMIYDRFKYVTYLAEHNKEGIITRLSQGFDFGTHENIEFASGMVEYKGDFIITLGIRDCKYALCKISKQRLTNLFENGRSKW